MLQAIWASVLVATGTFRALFTRVVYTEWIFFGCMAVGLFRLRRAPDYAPAYSRLRLSGPAPRSSPSRRLPWSPTRSLADPVESAHGLGLVLLGLADLFLLARKGLSRKALP